LTFSNNFLTFCLFPTAGWLNWLQNGRSDFLQTRFDFLKQRSDFFPKRSDVLQKRSDFPQQLSDFLPFPHGRLAKMVPKWGAAKT
jgi:hypothetical protein